MGESFADTWAHSEIDLKVEDALAYEPARVGSRRSVEVAKLLRILRVGRDSENADLRSPIALRLRKGYVALWKSYLHHDAKWNRGWELPEWRAMDDVPTTPAPRGIMDWTLERFLLEEVPGIQERAADCADVLIKINEASPADLEGRPRKKLRQDANSLLALLAKECDYVAWAFDLSGKDEQ